MRLGFAVLLLALTVSGCTEIVRTPQISSEPARSVPYQRFVPTGTEDRDYALDTKTGKLCKTWSWSVPPDSGLATLPECSELFTDFPDN